MAEGFITPDQARARLRSCLEARRAGGDRQAMRHLGEEIGVSKPCIARMANGQAAISPRVARAIGLRPAKVYLELE
jgi:hypothetical protein